MTRALLQRKRSRGTATPDAPPCAHCAKKNKQQLFRKAEAGDRLAEIAPLIVHEVLRSPSRPLDPHKRTRMGHHFRRDFSGVRIHTNALAARSAMAADAEAFPPGVPVVGLEPDLLARLNLTGGCIRNIAINAAFLAAARRIEVTMPIVMEAVRTELEKLQRPASEVDLAQLRAREGGRR